MLSSKEINARFLDLVEKVPFPVDSQTTDFIGINIFDEPDSIFFKAYFDDHHSMPDAYGLLEQLYQHSLVRYYENVYSSRRDSHAKLAIALKDRNQSTLSYVLNLINQKGPWAVREQEELYARLRGVSSILLPADIFSPLYQIAFSGNEHMIQLLSYYIILRKCEDFEKTYKNYQNPDRELMDHFAKCGVKELEKLAVIVEPVLQQTEAHLWLLGMETKQEGPTKYKLYLDSLESVSPKFFEHIYPTLAHNLFAVNLWCSEHPELSFCGAAFGLDTMQKISLNLYFSFRRSTE